MRWRLAFSGRVALVSLAKVAAKLFAVGLRLRRSSPPFLIARMVWSCLVFLPRVQPCARPSCPFLLFLSSLAQGTAGRAIFMTNRYEKRARNWSARRAKFWGGAMVTGVLLAFRFASSLVQAAGRPRASVFLRVRAVSFSFRSLHSR